MSYRLSLHAESDIIHLYQEGSRLFGPAQADHYHRGLEQLFDLLALNPEMARERTELSPPVRVQRYLSHIVLYIIEDGAPFILRVRHGSEDWLSDGE